MNKIEKLFKGLVILISKPQMINCIIDESDYYKKKFISKFKLKNGLPQIDISELDSQLDIKVDPYAFLEGGSTPLDLALLKLLAIKYKVKDYLEIGTWRGESVANVADVVDKAYTLNLPSSDLKNLGKSSNYIDSHAFFSKNLKNVVHLQGNSHTFDFESLNQKFDMIFIDGDHHYESVKKDTETAFKLLKNENSIIVWHDYASNPETIRWDVLSGIYDSCPAEFRSRLFHVSNTLCAIYINDKFNTNLLEPYAFPSKYFSLEVKIKNA